MTSGLLLVLLIAVFVVGLLHLYRADVFFAAIYFYLFVYCIFAVTGYLYFPELSRLISAYFGTEIELRLLVFLILSFAALYVALLVAVRYRHAGLGGLVVRRVQFNYAVTTTCLVVSVISFQLAGLVLFGDNLNYSNASNPEFIEGAGLAYRAWFLSFKLTPPIIAVLYAAMRYELWPGQSSRWLLRLLVALQGLVFINIAHTVGNRLDLVSVLNAVVFVELIKRNGRVGRSGSSAMFYAGLAAVVVVSLAYMTWLSSTRTNNPFEGLTLARIVVFQDYFVPAHILFAAISYNLVDPLMVLKSNILNSMIMMNHPYLQESVANIFNPGVSSRSTGYAFYLLSEGYLAFGMGGFVYNAVVVATGLWIWRKLTLTQSNEMNAIALPILALDAVNLCRGQSAYFIKDLYSHFLPALIVTFLVTGFYYAGVRVRIHAR